MVAMQGWRADRRGQAGSGYQEAGEQEESVVQPRVSFNGNRRLTAFSGDQARGAVRGQAGLATGRKSGKRWRVLHTC